MPVTRRKALVGGAVGALAWPALAVGSDEQDWAEFRQRFLLPEGRVVDTGNRNVSHSEGQGWAMLAAVRANDQPSFNRILSWTLANLRRPSDSLHAWRWSPDSTPPVTDLNNASDGDLFIAWALVEAAERWNQPELMRRGLAIARDLQRACFFNLGRRWFFLPGAYGFRNPNRIVLNLSYYALPAFHALGRLTRDPVWARVEADGLALLGEARYGRWGLPPDWLEIDLLNERLAVARNWPPRFSFDAVRIPLYLCWGGSARHVAVQSSVEFWMQMDGRPIPAWTDFRGDQIAPYPANAGIASVAQLCRAAREGRGNPALMPRLAAATDYYAAALAMLARMVWRDLRLG
jgi:endoglucanase